MCEMKHAGPAPILRGFSKALGFWGSGRKKYDQAGSKKVGNTKQPTTQKLYISLPVLYWQQTVCRCTCVFKPRYSATLWHVAAVQSTPSWCVLMAQCSQLLALHMQQSCVVAAANIHIHHNSPKHFKSTRVLSTKPNKPTLCWAPHTSCASTQTSPCSVLALW